MPNTSSKNAQLARHVVDLMQRIGLLVEQNALRKIIYVGFAGLIGFVALGLLQAIYGINASIL